MGDPPLPITPVALGPEQHPLALARAIQRCFRGPITHDEALKMLQECLDSSHTEYGAPPNMAIVSVPVFDALHWSEHRDAYSTHLDFGDQVSLKIGGVPVFKDPSDQGHNCVAGIGGFPRK